ncbi:MAG: DHHW family protein [Alphaproteobacteria bacterium]
MIDKIFIAILGIALLIPASHINRADVSEHENRTLAAAPKLLQDNHKLNNKFGVEYDKWFSDRFFGRGALIKIYNKQSGVTGSLQVLSEKDNWLFYKLGDSLRNFANMDRFTDTELESIKNYLTDINNWCKKHNKKFVFFIAPDKNKIYGEHITKVAKKHPDTASRSRQLIDYLHKNSDVVAIYPYDALHADKDIGLLYYKNDTHWNTLGAYTGYKLIMRALNITPIKYNKLNETKHPTGDLTNMHTGLMPDNTTVYLLPDINMFDGVCAFGVRDDTHCENTHPVVRASVFTYRDSFSIALGPWYLNTFQSVDFRWRTDVRVADLEYIKQNADIVILEMVERNLTGLPYQKFPRD